MSAKSDYVFAAFCWGLILTPAVIVMHTGVWWYLLLYVVVLLIFGL